MTIEQKAGICNKLRNANLDPFLPHRIREEMKLRSLLGLVSIEDLDRKHEVVLPTEIFEKVRGDLKATLQDARERFVLFDVEDKNSNPTITREGSGPPLNLEGKMERVDFGRIKISAHCNIRRSSLEALQDAFSARSATVFAHTHPVITDDVLKTINIHTLTDILTPDQLKELLTHVSNHFSGDDLFNIEAESWFIRSMLLASNGGYTWIINPHTDKWPLSFSSCWSQYGQDMSQRINSIASTMHRIKHHAINWHRSVDTYLRGKLLEFCTRKGFVGFYNNDINCPELVSLRFSP